MTHMNEEFAERLVAAPTALIKENDAAATNRLMMLFDQIEFDGVKRICDIGSRFLEQTMEMSYIFPDAELYAFEPVPSSYNICLDNKKQLAAEYQDRINVYNVAVGESNQEITFHEVDDTGSDHNVGASSKYKFIPGLNGSFFNKNWNQREIKVQQVTLDHWRQENNVGAIDLLWVDAQGGELDVFRGAVETLRDVKVILTEVGLEAYYQGQSLKPQIDEFLKAQGFRELENGFKQNFRYEGDTIYIKD
jgi:FkbM family methyltransferase